MSEPGVREEDLLDPRVPLCFDTNVIYGERETRRLLQSLRDRFPERRLLIPAVVVAERMRQLQEKWKKNGRTFDPSIIKDGFLKNPDLRLEICPFDLEAATGAWMDLAKVFDDKCWQPDWALRSKLPKGRLCGQRCRLGDHLLHVLGRQHHAILVTNDAELLNEARHIAPGALTKKDLLQRLGLA